MMNLEGKKAFDLDLLPQILYVCMHKTPATCLWLICDRELKVGGPSLLLGLHLCSIASKCSG